MGAMGVQIDFFKWAIYDDLNKVLLKRINSLFTSYQATTEADNSMMQ